MEQLLKEKAGENNSDFPKTIDLWAGQPNIYAERIKYALMEEHMERGSQTMSSQDFLKIWAREASSQPGLMLEVLEFSGLSTTQTGTT